MSEKTEPVAGQSQPPPGCSTGGSGAVSNVAELLNLTHSDSRVVIGFNYKEMPDESRVARYRAQLVEFLQRTNCKSLRFDMRGIKIVPSRMLGFFVTLKNEGHDIELFDVEQGVQDVIRLTKLTPLFTIHPLAK